MRIIIAVACLWLATSPLWGQIAFHSNRIGTSQIYTMNSDGSNQTQLTFNEENKSGYPVWSPNGKQIVFLRYMGQWSEVVKESEDKNFGESVSRIVMNYDVFVMDADGTNQRNLTNHPELDGFPDWSPDGKQIVFASTRGYNYRKGIDINIFVMSADGGHIRQITKLKQATTPRWSPDGKRIAFATDDFELNKQVYVVDADDGRKPWRVSSPIATVEMILGGWSPDGKQILYREATEFGFGKSTPVIATLDFRRRDVIRWKRVSVPKGTFSTSDFSADGKSILFSADLIDDGEKNDEIYRFVLADRQLIQLTHSPGRDAGPHEWNPRLSVAAQDLTPTLWGKIKATQ